MIEVQRSHEVPTRLPFVAEPALSTKLLRPAESRSLGQLGLAIPSVAEH